MILTRPNQHCNNLRGGINEEQHAFDACYARPEAAPRQEPPTKVAPDPRVPQPTSQHTTHLKAPAPLNRGTNSPAASSGAKPGDPSFRPPI
jgi:hypothetical protein